METLNARELTISTRSLAVLNKYNRNYTHDGGVTLNEKAVQKDFKLLLEYSKAYQKRTIGTRPVVGDCLQLPDGQTVYFCHIHAHSAQTCQSGSFHLSSSGYISYSGGLDSGILLNEIELTSERDILSIWFCHNGYLCGGCAIYANIECRVWKTKAGADLSGIPQIKRLRKRKLKDQSETITHTDGNGRAYTEHLPEVVIIRKDLPEGMIQTIMQETGLCFEEDVYYVQVYWSQPMTIAQLDKLKAFTQFQIIEHRNTFDYQPILVFEHKPSY